MALRKMKKHTYILVALCLGLLFFYPLIFSGRTLFFRDIHLWFFPMKAFLAEALKSGSIPFWSPHSYCGSPFMSDIQSGVFYPLSLIFAMFPFPWSFNIYVVSHFFLGFVFFYQFIKGLGLSRQTALFTSISFCYGSYTIASLNTLNNLSTLAWIPAILWSFNKAESTNRKSGHFLTVVFLCMAILGGEPQLFILSAALLFFYAIIYVPRNTPEKNFYLKKAVVIPCLILSAILLTMVQLGPTYLDYQHSARLGGLSYTEASRHSLNLGMLKHLVVPLPFHGDFTSGLAALKDFFPGEGEIPWLVTIYPGMVIAPLALFGLLFNFSKKMLLWLFTFLLTLTLALGDTTPAHYIFYKILPFFRFPDKFIFFTGFSLLVMAAYGYERLILLLNGKGTRSYALTFLIILFLIGDLYSNHRNINPSWESSFYKYHHPDLQPVLDDPETFRVYLDPEVITPPSVQHTINNHHIRWQMMLSPNLGILHGLDHVGGVPALELRYQYLISELLSKPWPEKIHFLRLANVKYIISNQSLDSKAELEGRVQRINSLIYEIRDHLPRAWLVGQLHSIEKGTGDELIDGSFDPASSAITKSEIITTYSKPFFREVDSIKYEGYGKIHIELTAQEPAILVLSESSYPGWRVWVDGEEKECLWLNLLFQGVGIGTGKHKIDFIFRPKHFDGFLSISIGTFLLFLFLWGQALLYARRKGLSFRQSRTSKGEQKAHETLDHHSLLQ